MFKNGKIKKYKVSVPVLIITIILTLVSGICYWFLCMYINNNAGNENIALFTTFKDVVLVLLTILGTNLLVSILVEVYNKNKVINEFFNDEIVTSPDYYKRLNYCDRTKMLNTLELMDHCNNNDMIHTMYKSIQSKMRNHLNDTYYFDSCEYNVRCVRKENYFEKEVLRTMKLKSYDDTYNLKKLKLAEINYTEICGEPSFEIIKVTVNGSTIDNDNIQKEIVDNDDLLDIKNGYTKTIRLYLKDTLNLSNNEATQVVVNSISRCPLNDVVSSYRTSRPCKNFTVNYIAEPKKYYRVIAHAFGFHECARSYPNGTKNNEVKVGFNDWIFTDDGICIIMTEK